MSKENKQVYNLTSDEVLQEFNSTASGISEDEAKRRLKIYGQNKISEKIKGKWFKLVLNQFNDALVWILLVAAGLALFFHEYRDATIILIIIGINAIIGFFQEFKAERILDGIRKFTTDRTLIFRKGVKKEIDTKFIVPGDVVFVSAGDNVPADGYILESYTLRVDSFVFTGESKPKTKGVGAIIKENMPLADINNMLFMGETIVAGEAKLLVTSTGANTELGKIADLAQEIQNEPTPLQKQMRRLGKDVTIAAVFIGILVMIAGQYFKLSLYDNFLFALALAVSVVPEGLPAAISVALSLGMKRLLKDNVLAKKLNAVETLGSVSVICTDKTGTITKNELTVTQAVINDQIIEISGVGYNPNGSFFQNGKIIEPREIKGLNLLFKIGTLCNDAELTNDKGIYKILGDPTEGAIIVAGKKYNSEENFYKKGENKISEIPFSSERMRMSVIYKNKNTISYVKGSPDVILNLCDEILIDGKIQKITQERRNKIEKIYNEMSQQALRVLALAYRNLDAIPENEYLEEAEKNLTWVGMLAMIDPPRADVKQAIAECLNLGIKVIMITGDYEITAKAIAENIGLLTSEDLVSKRVINGGELDKLSDNEIYYKIKNGACVFARTTPRQKLRIAETLKKHKEVIAMTGDGVNDAPALKRADIGVAMGIIGTDVSKEAADMILLDDNFASIVKGVREGRTIFANLKKFVHYVFTSNASELFTVILGVLLGLPSPITAVQILATDLGTDVFPSFSLGLEPAEPESGKKKISLGVKPKIIDFQGFRRIVYLGLIMAAGATTAFILSMLRGGWHFGQSIAVDSVLYIKSTTAAYAVISMTQMANLLQSRSEKLSPFRLGFFKNKYAIAAIFISIAILLLFMYAPFFQKYLHLAPIDWQDWLVVIITCLVIFAWEEARKEECK